MLIWFASIFALALGVGFSPVGKRLALGLPLAALIGFQAFRLPLELVMHRAVRDGVMPNVMSFSGYNFDIVSGITAVPMALWVATGRAPRGVVWAWNLMGLALLLTIAVIAALASPVIGAFGPDQLNVWVTRFPFTSMAVMVGGALLGHVLVFRKLSAQVTA